MSGYVVRVAQTIGGATAVHYLGRRIPSRTKAETSMRLAGIRGRWVDFVDARVFDDRAEAWIYVESLRVEDGLREWTDPISYVFDAHTIREVPTSGPCGYGWCSSLHAAEGQVHVTPDGLCSPDVHECEKSILRCKLQRAEEEVERLTKGNHDLSSRLETLLAVVSPLRHVNDSTPLVEASALVRNVVTVLHALDDRPGVVCHGVAGVAGGGVFFGGMGGPPPGIIGTVST